MIKNIFTVGGWTLISRITGFVRDIVMAAILGARSAGKVASVGCTVSRLAVMFTSVACGTTRRSAPMREKLVDMPSRSAQPATKPAKPIPTPSITAAPRNSARSRRRATFCAASRISSQ